MTRLLTILTVLLCATGVIAKTTHTGLGATVTIGANPILLETGTP